MDAREELLDQFAKAVKALNDTCPDEVAWEFGRGPRDCDEETIMRAMQGLGEKMGRDFTREGGLLRRHQDTGTDEIDVHLWIGNDGRSTTVLLEMPIRERPLLPLSDAKQFYNLDQSLERNIKLTLKPDVELQAIRVTNVETTIALDNTAVLRNALDDLLVSWDEACRVLIDHEGFNYWEKHTTQGEPG
jgi:hypothetical protein